MTHEEALGDLELAVLRCQNCRLGNIRRQAVFGEGNPEARLVFIGEGPGAEEDRQGRPFVGAAGQLLDKMLSAMGMHRFQQVYILNAVKCRPPNNRTPLPDEVEACRPHFDRQLAILDPAIVVLLGSTALKAVMGSEWRITRARGQWIEQDGRWWMPTYHPAALLRNPAWKRDVWLDLKRVIDKYRELVDPNHDTPHYPRP
ncbi:uracil-DNA glycosylase [Sulfobacillus harzensis]|uniref:Type-4 uracil-DNA glycosylase n=1 Tax=Sulfobacillus harzensis TaxID=2729629 RepID=A0A7Y0Q1H8_9FIRM|nr:uracil-DNA glycosylase [Sulfobacillus harzensis]NMP20851.1 uracil-DNA glycosylase [Sulfobacillus harzensis]